MIVGRREVRRIPAGTLGTASEWITMGAAGREDRSAKVLRIQATGEIEIRLRLADETIAQHTQTAADAATKLDIPGGCTVEIRRPAATVAFPEVAVCTMEEPPDGR